MKAKTRRIYVVVAALIFLGVATLISLTALQDNMLYFYYPSQLEDQNILANRKLRIGGIVAPDSIEKMHNLTTHFQIKDTKSTISVVYSGVLPDLFREGQGVIAEGVLINPTTFQAETVLAKHDENYRPPNADATLGDLQETYSQ